MWDQLSVAQREAIALNVVAAFLPLANLSGGSSVPLVLPLIGVALSLYVIHLYRKIRKGEA
jgi:hypothetical protein